ncbi:hypothetical protein ACDY97_30335 [Rhizobium mongolense]|uniref:hypothetical protein n=1 Tax=Rhizobium mongolense TaxID=57676 RepID=UPI003555E20F
MTKERTPIAANILSISRSRAEQAQEVAGAATSYMPTTIDLDKLMPSQAEADQAAGSPEANAPESGTDAPEDQPASKSNKKASPALKGRGKEKAVSKPAREKKRISLYLDDDVLTRIFQVSLQHREQMSTSTHRLIIEALEARGL